MTEPAASTLPPRQHLAHVVCSLVKHLPGQLEGLLQHSRFAEGAGALARLANGVHLDSAVASLPEPEAERLAELLLERWRDLAEPILEPVAAIVAPAEIWIGVEPIRVPIEVVVLGTESGWDAVWDGAISASGARAVLIADPGAVLVSCRVHVRARTAAGRVALIAAASIPIRRPAVTVRDDGLRIVVLDQQGVPAVGVVLHIGEVAHRTGEGGLVELGQAPAHGASLRVQGVSAGRLPEKT